MSTSTRESAWRSLRPYRRGHRRAMGSVLGFTLLEAALTAATPWPLKLLVDHALAGRELPEWASWVAEAPGGGTTTGLVAWLAGATVLLFVVLQLVGLASSTIQATAGSRMTMRLASDVFEHLEQQSPHGIKERATGDSVQRVVVDSRCARDLVFGGVVPLVTSIATLAVLSVVMWSLDPTLALIATGVAVPVALLIRKWNPDLVERSFETSELEGRLMAAAEQGLAALPLIQASAREADEHDRFKELSDETVRAGLRTTATQVWLYTGTSSITALATALVLGVGGIRAVDGHLTLGGLLVFLAYLLALYSPIETLAQVTITFGEATARTRRVMTALRSPITIEDPPHPRSLPRPVRGDVCFEGVTVGYRHDEPVLSDVDLEAPAGTTIALVGRTGSGKSTLVSLLPRFLDPSSGRVTLDGVDVREISLTELRQHVALVSQDALLLPISIADNIAYGRPHAGRAEIESAARAANVLEFVDRLPDGLDTIVGERGATLSGGQRQRVAIARALLKNAPVLILDEPTSALDAGTEHLILQALERLIANRTTFVVAHRFSTIRYADVVVVVDEGRIAATGTHGSLLESNELYAHLHRLQTATSALPEGAR